MEYFPVKMLKQAYKINWVECSKLVFHLIKLENYGIPY